MSEACLPPYRIMARVQRIAETKNYNHSLLNIPTAWRNSKGKHVKVGILDTGRPSHDDLEVSKAWSVYPDYINDENGHGTHVAGLVGARENGHGVLGIAPECTINTYTVLDKGGVGSAYNVAAAIDQAIEDGCHILNLSLGFSSVGTIGLAHTACELAAQRGVIIVAAAGNQAGRIDQPASYPFVIAVGAVDQQKKRAGFSNYGPEMDFAVGGVDVYSTWLENGYAKLSGTSMAAPVFSGICALILGEHIEREQAGEEVKTPIMNVYHMIDHVKRFAFDVGEAGWDEEFGFGIPIFRGPDTCPATMNVKTLILSELDQAINHLTAIRQGVMEL